MAEKGYQLFKISDPEGRGRPALLKQRIAPDQLSTAPAPAGHAATHQHLGTDEVAQAAPAAGGIPKAGGGGQLASGWIPPTAPAAHAATHKHGGSDEVAAAAAAANAIPKAGGAGELDSAWLLAATEALKGAVKKATAAANSARGTVTAASAPDGADTIDRVTLNTNLTTMRDNIHTELTLLHDTMNTLKAVLRTAGIMTP